MNEVPLQVDPFSLGLKVMKNEEEEEKKKEQTGWWKPRDDSRTGRGGGPAESRPEGTPTKP